MARYRIAPCVVALAALSACAGRPVAPHATAADAAPAAVVASAAVVTPAAAAAAAPDAPGRCTPAARSRGGYLASGAPDLLALLPPPPPAGSPAEAQDLQAVLEAQRAAHAAGSTARAVADAEPSCGRFSDALAVSPASAAAAPALDFATRAAQQASQLTGPAKRYWQRPRPYLRSAEVQRLADVAPDAGPGGDYARQRDRTSYPSGHAALGTACAIVLASMVPERRVELFARAREYTGARTVIGAHYPSDVDAGRLAGTLAMAAMFADPCFQADLAAASTTLRAALQLPALAP